MLNQIIDATACKPTEMWIYNSSGVDYTTPWGDRLKSGIQHFLVFGDSGNGQILWQKDTHLAFVPLDGYADVNNMYIHKHVLVSLYCRGNGYTSIELDVGPLPKQILGMLRC